MGTTMVDVDTRPLTGPKPTREDPRSARSEGWLRATAPLWPLGLARVIYGYLWWRALVLGAAGDPVSDPHRLP